MTAFETYIQTELPRRSAHLTKTITGWDASPNDPGAPAILTGSPLGTWFREETAGKWWRKTESVWAEAGGGGSGGGVERTTEDMIWEVDYATGVSPPAGTVITSQAEYDALGAPLKYMQDVERCRPVFVDHLIKANILAGNQYAMQDNFSVGYHAWLVSNSAILSTPQAKTLDLTLPSEERNIGVLFIGARNDVYTGIAGTLANSSDDIVFTRSFGTWTPNELIGKFAEFTSGSAAGRHCPIVANDATTCTVQSTTTGMGATTLTAFELTTHMIPKTGPTGVAAPYGMQLIDKSSVLRIFKYLDFQDNGAPLNYNLSAYIYAWDCVFRGTITTQSLFTNVFYYSIVHFSSASGSSCFRIYGQLSLYYCWVRGRGSAGSPLAYISTSGRIPTRGTRFSPDAGITYGVIGIDCNGTLNVTGDSLKIDGVSTAPGITAVQASSDSLVGLNRAYINNCSAALSALQCRIGISGFKGSGNTRLFNVTEGSQIGVLNSTLLAIYTTAKASIDGQDYTAELANQGDSVEGLYGSKLTIV